MHFPLILSMSLALAEHWLWLILLVALATGASILSYRRTIPEVTGSRRIVLITLRALALSLLLFLLFEPVLNLLRQEVRSPRIAILLDDSRSMTISDAKTERKQVMLDLLNHPEWKKLIGGAEIEVSLITGRTHRLERFERDSLTWKGGETDLDAAFRAVRDRMAEENIRAVLVMSDGVYTSGRNPMYSAQSLGVPVSTIAIGDTALKKDVLIGNVITNDIGYVDTEMPVDVSVKAVGYGSESVTVTLKEGGTVVDSKVVNLQPGTTEYRTQFQYSARTEGAKRLIVEVSPRPGELTQRNNRQNAFMTIRKSKMQVVVIAGAPSPDVSMLDQMLNRDKNIQVRMFIEKPGRQWYDSAPTVADLNSADCLFLVGFPTSQSSTTVLGNLRQVMEEKGKPMYILFSRELDAAKLKSALDPWLPLDIGVTRPQETQVQYQATPDSKDHPLVTTGLPPEIWDKLPPLYKTESSYKARPGAEKLATMKINSIAFNEPILLTRRLNRGKLVVMTAYGLWRWQMATDVMNGQVPERLISNSIRWLTTRDDEKRVRITPVRKIFDNGDPVEFTGQVYNESDEPVSDAVVNIAVKGPRGERTLVLHPLGAGRYSGSMESPGEGDYTFQGIARRGTGEFGRDAGRFAVGEQNAEFQETRANASLLRQLVARTEDRSWTNKEIAGLSDAILQAPTFVSTSAEQRSDITLWNAIWILIPVILLFAAEWYIRKRTGLL